MLQPFDIQIISMKKSKRRSRFMDFTYDFSFYDAHTKPVSFNTNKAQTYYARSINKGEIGCTTSHYELYKQLIDDSNQYNWHLILEDDAQLESEFNELYDNFTKSTQDWNKVPTVLVLGHSKTDKKFQWVQALKQPMKTKLKIAQHEFGQKYVNLVGTVGYIINDAAIHQILQHQPYWLADDWSIIESFGVQVLHIRKNLVYEKFDGISSTNNIIEVQHNIIKKPVKTIAKIILNRIFYLIGYKKRFY